jgi:hypothetical protein
MKGVILDCFEKLVEKKLDKEKWQEILRKAGMSKFSVFLAVQDYSDEDVLKLVQAACDVLGLSLQELADLFGDFWINDYGAKVYKVYFNKAKTAKDFILNTDHVHQLVTQTIPHATPPRFEYEWEDDNTLIITYKSKRALIEFVIGILKGVAKYYKEKLIITKISDNKVRIIFA